MNGFFQMSSLSGPQVARSTRSQFESRWISMVMKQIWIGIFRPECLMMEAGNEYAVEVEVSARSLSIYHDILPLTAKWRTGIAKCRCA